MCPDGRRSKLVDNVPEDLFVVAVSSYLIDGSNSAGIQPGGGGRIFLH